MFAEINIFQMPKELGGDWAFRIPGLVMDGYPTREEALRAAHYKLYKRPKHGPGSNCSLDFCPACKKIEEETQ